MNEWVNKAFSLDIDYNNHIINHVLFYNINLCIWFTTFHIAYPVLYSVLMIDNELLKGNQYWKSHKTYIKCRSWYVNSICTERTTATAVDSSLQLHRPAAALLYCSAAENSADGQHWRSTRRHFSSYLKAKPQGLSDLPPFKAPNGGGMAHGDPLSTKGHCPTVILGQHHLRDSWTAEPHGNSREQQQQLLQRWED